MLVGRLTHNHSFILCLCLDSEDSEVCCQKFSAMSMNLVEQNLDSVSHPSHACLKFSHILSAWKPKGFWRKFYFSLCNCYCFFFDCLCCGYKHTRIYTPIHDHRHTEGDTFHCKRQSTLRKIVWSASHFVDIFLLVCCDALKYYECVCHSVCVPLDVCVTLCIWLFLALFCTIPAMPLWTLRF